LPESERRVLLQGLAVHTGHPDPVVQEQVAWSMTQDQRVIR
jgi:hypothetical protein